MKLILLGMAVLTAVAAEPKARIFLTESGAVQISGKEMHFSGPTSSESIEVMRAFQRYCPEVAITNDKAKADFVVRLDREGPSPVTPFVRGNKAAVFNRDADLVYSQSSRTLAPAVKGVCGAVTGAAKR